MIFTAITGSIGCGKTTIANILREQGFLVYDIDKWVKYLYYKKSFLNVVKLYFPEVFDGDNFDKKKLRNVVFSDKNKLKILEGIIHPLLREKLKKIIRRNKNKGLVFVDVALAFEMGWDKYFDFILLADVDEDIQRERVMKRDKITADDFNKINEKQMPMKEKRKKVDLIINTGVSINKLKKNILEITEGLKLYE